MSADTNTRARAMRNLVLLTVLGLLLTVATAGHCAVSDEGLVAHWSFDEGSGDSARDLTGHGHDATISGPQWVRSPRGYALRFDGVDDVVTYANVDSMNLQGDLTLMVWVKTRASEAPDTNRLIFGDSGAGVQRNLNLRISGYRVIMFEWADGTRNAILSADADLLDGSWKHLAVVADSGAGRITMFLDGEPVAQMRMPLPISRAPTPGRLSGQWAGGCLKGDLDDVRLYHRALSADEVREAFESEATLQIGRARTVMGTADGERAAVTTATLRNLADEALTVRLRGPRGEEELTLRPGGEVELPVASAALEPLFGSRSDLYLVNRSAEPAHLTVTVSHDGFEDVQESDVAPGVYLEPIRLSVEDPWRREMAPEKTDSISMRVELQVARELREAGRLEVGLTSRASGEVVARQTVEGPEAQVELTFDAADLPWGAYDVRAALLDGAGRETVATDGPATVLPGGKQRIEVLNNLCSELVNAAQRGLLDARQIEFMNPRDGWCFFRLEGRATLRLDDEQRTILRRRADEPAEAMRLLPAGRHRLRVSGEPTQIIVRAIPALVHNVYPTAPMIRPFGPHTWERMSAWTLPNCNMIESHQADLPEAAEWVGMGRSWIMNRTAPGRAGGEPPTAEEMLAYWRSTPGWGTERISGMQVDEYGPSFGDQKLIATARSAAMLAEDPEFAGRLWIPFVVRMYGTDVAELFMRTTLAAGWPFSIERYIGELPTEAADREQIEALLVGDAEEWEAALPGSVRRAIMTLMYAYLPYCTTNRCPTADFHVHLQMQMQVLATDPAWFGLWGVQPYRANYVDEETLNCMGALLRHYCIEGATKPLLDDPYELAHVRNPDFARGTEGWEVRPAADGSISTGEFAGYGTLQGRYPWASIGESFLLMTRSANGPNIVGQEITGLQPGRLYSLKLITADHQDLLAGESRDAPSAVTMRVEGADVQEGDFSYPFTSARGPQPFTREHPFHMVYHYLQFRATGPTARLTLTDWQSDTEPGGPIGQETMFSFVEVQPVFEG